MAQLLLGGDVLMAACPPEDILQLEKQQQQKNTQLPKVQLFVIKS